MFLSLPGERGEGMARRAGCILVYAAVVLLFFAGNPQDLRFPYGDGNGRYADRVDSYSENIVRNTIKRNILDSDGSFLPIKTSGYPDDYSYQGTGYHKYTSNLSLQTVPATLLARSLHLKTEGALDRLFDMLRLVNAALFSLGLTVFLYFFCQARSVKHHFVVPLLLGGSAGFLFYSHNLYFMSSLMVLPAAVIACRSCLGRRLSPLLIFFSGVAYFARGYEFATVFTLLTAFSTALFTDDGWRRKLRSGAVAFAAVCLSFAFCLVAHVILIDVDSGWMLSFTESARQAFVHVKLRTATTSHVPAPFGPEFFSALSQRWLAVAFSLNAAWWKLSERQVLFLLFLAGLSQMKRRSGTEMLIICYGVAGYLSWYVCAYQHIMWHTMYDWYIFSLTVGLSFSLLSVLYLDGIIGFITRKFDRGDSA
ncbi:hypothetical protein [Geomonas oryzae]|uniref:hypothetical protein n=1 Tax=Geomonas oryzae TaxID=2364273 RepID=UPI00100BFEDA|nr:hypothetical protein [Geomonas oryzae]